MVVLPSRVQSGLTTRSDDVSISAFLRSIILTSRLLGSRDLVKGRHPHHLDRYRAAMSRLIPTPNDVFRKIDGVVEDVDALLARVDVRLVSVDDTLSEA